MKKTYISPNTNVIEVKMESLLVDYSNSTAAKGAESLSRQSNSSWDDEE